MSDTITAPDAWNGWTVTDETSDGFVLKHADGRTIGVRYTDTADLMDLLEASAGVGDGAVQRWMTMATPIISVTSLNGVPAPSANTKERIRARAKEIGNERFAALTWALYQRKPTTANLEVAKN